MTLSLNPEQQAAVEHPGGPLLVLAGAGSGKTRVLTARIAQLITARGVAPHRIFAVTFTNKAAAEMRARVAALLGRDPKGLWIGTFHSLSARLLRREAPLLGFGPNFTIYDADEAGGVLYIAMRHVEGSDLKTLIRSEGAMDAERAQLASRRDSGAVCEPLAPACAQSHRPRKRGHARSTVVWGESVDQAALVIDRDHRRACAGRGGASSSQSRALPAAA